MVEPAVSHCGGRVTAAAYCASTSDPDANPPATGRRFRLVFERWDAAAVTGGGYGP